jgi:hypothetical protein
MEEDLPEGPVPAPRPSPFPVVGAHPGPRCGHTLTTISGLDGELTGGKLIMFGKFGGYWSSDSE